MADISRNSNSRHKRLASDLSQLEELHDKAPSIFGFSVVGKSLDAPDKYLADIALKSITGIGKFGKPRVCSNFVMKIDLPKRYPNLPPHIRVSPAPFHPHFRRKTAWFGKSYGIWIDPSTADQGLGGLVLRILRSLQFEESSIEVASQDIGNRKAMDWYVEWTRGDQVSDFRFLVDELPMLPSPHQSQHGHLEQGKDFSFVSQGGEDSGEEPMGLAPKGFEIVETTPPYEPELAESPTYGELRRSQLRERNEDRAALYIKPKPRRAMFNHISWGKMTNKNVVEQGGILVGQSYRDRNSGRVFGVVEHAIPGYSASGTSAYLEMNHETWKVMIDKVDKMLDADPNSKLQIIGWYHTHPNQLGVFMSGTDRGTQSRFFSEDWQFAVVLNPHKEIWGVFYGKNADECLGIMVTDINLA